MPGCARRRGAFAGLKGPGSLLKAGSAGPGACLLVLVLGLLAAAPAPAQEGYLGDEVCSACHGPLLEHYQATIHAKVFKEGTARTALMLRGCEGCHGPGAAHVAAGGAKGTEGMLHLRADGTEDASAQSAVCLQCHQGGEQVYWHGSAHDGAAVSCSACHTVMKNVSRNAQLSRSSEAETCAQCHLIQRSRMYRNAHMPVRPTEAKMSCGSCHNPHGTVADKLISDHTVNDNCYRCHAEKRGPFLWEHPPVYESCLNCHDPHGTTRAGMLHLSLPRLCTQCHVSGHPGQPRSPSHRFVVGKSCLHCHVNVHGSNHPAAQGLTR